MPSGDRFVKQTSPFIILAAILLQFHTVTHKRCIDFAHPSYRSSSPERGLLVWEERGARAVDGSSAYKPVSPPGRAGLSPTLCRSAAHGRTRPPPAGPSRVLSLHSLSLYPSRTNSMPRELGPVQPDYAWVELHWLAVGESWELANKILGAFLLLLLVSFPDRQTVRISKAAAAARRGVSVRSIKKPL